MTKKSPQLENGFTRIAHEIVEALAKTHLTSYQSRLLWTIFRKTYGFGKKEDWISNSQLVKSTGIHKAHISRTKKELIDRNIVTSNGNKIQFNKDYSQWKELPNKVTKAKVTKRGNTVTNLGNRKLPELADTIDTSTIDTITIDRSQKKFSDKVEKLSNFLFECIKRNNKGFKGDPRKWDSDMDKILRIDKRPYDEAAKLLQLVQEDDFWKANILSGKKFRDKYDQLYMKMSGKANNTVIIS